MNALTRRLVLKELHHARGAILMTLAAGVVSLGVMPFGRVAFNVGSLCWMSAMVAFGVIISLTAIVNERKENALLFALSLPLSPADYRRAKLLGILAGFLLVWAPLSLATIGLILFTDIPDGLLSFAVLLNLFLLTNFSFVLSGALMLKTEGAVTGLIIVTNMGVTLFMFMIGGLSAIHTHMLGPIPVWNATHTGILVTELVCFAAALSLPFVTRSRNRDYL
jgi:ABC-2 type transport system permease protein